MVVRKIAVRGRPRTGPESRPPKRNRAWLFLFLTLGAGAVSGILALVGPAVVTDVGAAITTHVAATTDQPIQASTLFPPVPVQHRVIDIYDPPPPRRVAPPPAAAPQPSPSPSPRRSPRPTPSHSPRPTPSGSPRPTPSGSPRPTPPPNN
jgi:hypothetical protein